MFPEPLHLFSAAKAQRREGSRTFPVCPQYFLCSEDADLPLIPLVPKKANMQLTFFSLQGNKQQVFLFTST